MSADPPPTPRALFGPLLHEVQTRRLFPDGKHFVDMEPGRDPAEILRDYRALDAPDDRALLAFVTANFHPPDTGLAQFPPAPPGRSLADHIAAMWDQLARPPVTPPPFSSALPLPAPYMVAGGRFRELYYWDSYFTMLGLVGDNRHDLAAGLVDNCTWLIERYGHVPNGARSYYLGRSQPPVYHLMVGLCPSDDPAVQRRRLAAMVAEHSFWMTGAEGLEPGQASARVARLPGGAILNRYWDDREGPREESHAEDLLTATASGRPPKDVWRDLRAGAESGWDFSSRWLEADGELGSIRTTALIPVDLNCLLLGLERAVAALAAELGDAPLASAFVAHGRRRADALQLHCWSEREHRFGDVERVTGRMSRSINAAALFPLFVGLATQAQADATAANIRRHLLAPGGLRTTTVHSGQQWDRPNGWAPLQWIAVDGLIAYGQTDLACAIATRWMATVERNFAATGLIFEKYDIEQGRPAEGGEYPVQDGFGWTNGVARALAVRPCR